jgi:hypothetical protein
METGVQHIYDILIEYIFLGLVCNLYYSLVAGEYDSSIETAEKAPAYLNL